MKTVDELMRSIGYRKMFVPGKKSEHTIFSQDNGSYVTAVLMYDETGPSEARSGDFESWKQDYGRKLDGIMEKDVHILEIWVRPTGIYVKGWEEAPVAIQHMEDFYGLKQPLLDHIYQSGFVLEKKNPETTKEGQRSFETFERISKLEGRDGGIGKKNEVPYVTIVLITVNVILYLLTLKTPYFQNKVDDLTIRDGILSEPSQWYRFITHAFFHGGIAHISNNMLVLYVLGEKLEVFLGKVRFALYYLLCGVAGGVISVAFHTMMDETYQALGASGAIYGLVGIYVVLMIVLSKWRNTGFIYRLILAIVLTFSGGSMAESGIDHAAHTGGVLMGILLGVVFVLSHREIFGKRS